MTVTVAGRRHPLAVALLAVSLLLGACSSEPPDLEADLAAALERTLEAEFAYTFTVEASREALAELGEGGEAAAAFLNSFAISGNFGAPTGRVALDVLGQSVLDVRRFDAERTYVRLGLRDVPGLPGELTDPDTLLPALTRLELGDAVDAALATLLDGDWILIEGPLGATDLLDAASGGEVADRLSFAEAMGSTIEDRVRRFVDVTDHTETDGRRTFRVRVLLRELATAASASVGAGPTASDDVGTLPESVPGSVFVEDGVVTRARLDIGAPDDEAGQVELQLDLEDHGEVRAPAEPDARTTVRAEAFLDAVNSVVRFAAGVGVD